MPIYFPPERVRGGASSSEALLLVAGIAIAVVAAAALFGGRLGAGVVALDGNAAVRPEERAPAARLAGGEDARPTTAATAVPRTAAPPVAGPGRESDGLLGEFLAETPPAVADRHGHDGEDDPDTALAGLLAGQGGRDAFGEPGEGGAGRRPPRRSGGGRPPVKLDFTPEEKAQVDAALARLPEALRTLPLKGRGIVFNRDEPFAAFDRGSDIIFLGDAVFRLEESNAEALRRTGVDPGLSLERVLFHEAIHGFHDFNPGLVDEFLDLAFQAKQQALASDPRLPEQVAALSAIGDEIRARARKAGKPAADLVAEDADLRGRLFGVHEEISRIVESHGLPSRTPGDTHAGKNGQEFFAVVFEIARHDPEKFRRFRELAADGDPANDILSPAEIAFVDRHPELLK